MNSSTRREPVARPRRSRDDGRSLADFVAQIDVTCPCCRRRAIVRMLEGRHDAAWPACPARLTCPHCGIIRTQRLQSGVLRGYVLRSDGRDPYFHLPLWLATPTRHGMVIAYNENHLEALEAFVASSLRERSTPTTHCRRRRNSTMHSRLPRWMKLAANRAEMLNALARLRARLNDTSKD